MAEIMTDIIFAFLAINASICALAFGIDFILGIRRK